MSQWNFVNMLGRFVAGGVVVARAKNHRRGARWLFRDANGHQFVTFGSQLRNQERLGRVLLCAKCRPKRPSTVVRRNGHAHATSLCIMCRREYLPAAELNRGFCRLECFMQHWTAWPSLRATRHWDQRPLWVRALMARGQEVLL